MTAEVIYGVVFGKPLNEDIPREVDAAPFPSRPILIPWFSFSDDVQLPSDTEPTNEPA